MPRKSVDDAAYPANWNQIAIAVKNDAGWCCVRCGHDHDPASGYTLTVHHLDMNPANSAWWNLLALCQRCHLSVQARVDLRRPWVMAEHSEWFKPYVAGWYAYRYLGLTLSRDAVLARLEELLQLEKQALGVSA